MTTAYTSLLGLALPVTGELSGTWGDTVNNSITSLLDSAIAGTQTLTADTTLTTTTGAANQSRQAILLCSPASANITITAPAQSKIYTVINTSGTYTVKIRGVGPTTGVTLAVSESAVVAWNGTDFIRISSNSATTGNFTVNGNLVVTENTTLGDADTDTITQAASYVTGTQLKSAKTATNTLNLAAYDVDGTAYTNLITLTASNTPTLALTSTGVGTINNMSIGATTPAAGTFTSLSNSGNLTFTGTGNRITGDFSNATETNKVSFQTSTANSTTVVNFLPSGTNTVSAIRIYNNSDPTNASFGQLVTAGGSEIRLVSSITGTGTYLPMTFYTGGSERVRIDTSGNVGIGTTSPTAKLDTATSINLGLNYLNVAYDVGSGNGWLGGYNVTYSSAVKNVLTGALTAIYYAGDSVRFYTNASAAAGTTASERMRIDLSGNVGIGTSSPTTKLNIVDASATVNVQLESGSVAGQYFASTSAGGVYVGSSSAHPLVFRTNTTERMRIDSSGNLLVGGTAQRNLAKQSIEYTSGNNGLAIYCVANASATDFVTFTANAGTVCGVISRVGTTAAVVYTATSDYRLKENITPMTGALNKIARLKPVTYTWKNGGEAAEGFIAHELQEVCPDAVVGTKDEIDADGNPKYQAVDQSKIVALLTAAMQEQQALITALTARITALESN